jgi:predicted permease
MRSGRRSPEADSEARRLDDELRFHHQQTLAELRARGLTDEEAQREADRRFGDRHAWRARILAGKPRAGWLPAVVDGLRSCAAGTWRDVLVSSRTARRMPLFTLPAAGIFALQGAAATVMFALLNGVLVVPLPYPDADRLVYIWGRNAEVRAGFTNLPVSDPDLDDWRRTSVRFTAIGGVVPNAMTLTGGGDPERLAAVAVTGDLFAALGVEPLHGRSLQADDQRPGARPVVVLGHALWLRRFGGDPSAVGRTIVLDDRPVEVVGVMPAGFAFPRVEEISASYGFDRGVVAYVPWHRGDAGPAIRGNRYIAAAGRLKAGVSPAEAGHELREISAAGSARDGTDSTGDGFTLVPFRDQSVSGVRRSLWLLTAAILALVAIGCLNLTHLLLVRAGGRRREFAVRAALGASRAAIARQVVIEAMLIACAGGLAGLAAGAAALKTLVSLAPADLPRLDMIRVDGTVAVASALLLLLAAAAAGLSSIAGTGRAALERDLRSGSRAVTTAARSSRVLVGAEVALSVLLLLAAGLVVRSFDRLLRTSPGFDARGVSTFRIALPAARYPAGIDVRRGYDTLLATIAGVPGVQSVAYTWQLPMTGTQASAGYSREHGNGGMALIHRVSPGYFQAMGMRIVRGCGFDCSTDLPPAVINQAMERVQWPDRNPIGEIVTVNGVRSRIVGIVSDVRHGSLEQAAAPELYRQVTQRSMFVVVRSSPGVPEPWPGIRRAVAAFDALLPLSDVRTLEDRLSATTARRRFTLAGLTVFAALAGTLAIVGLYGVTALLVARLRREVGIRMVMGATPAGAIRLVMQRNVPVIAAGVAAGTIAAIGLGRFLQPFLFETSPTDPLTFTLVTGGLTTVALVATFVPARRAARVQPVEVLTTE